ncbi:SH3 domain-containing protein [Streptomyces sp. NPDC020883]|uniref:SH3 domain-containing protein n=1 Tax=unclassified Streptomyces TaxID=2593676 RepID=UPI0021B13218|nr:SH3 domain-containing protein [Streptomyces sp. BHT-5-2]
MTTQDFQGSAGPDAADGTGAGAVGDAVAEAAPLGAAVAGVALAGGSSYPVAPGYRVNVRQGAGTNTALVRQLPIGARVQIRCQMRGQWVVGPYGTSNLWDNIGPGEYVSDTYVHTGSSGMVAPSCMD